MTTTISADHEHHEQALAARARASRALFEAELALHDAHQTGVDEWVLAACNHLHAAVLDYTHAERVLAAIG